MSAKSKFRRIQELFQVGEVVVIETGDEKIPVWVAKPSSFEREEASRDARAARARQMLTFDRDEEQRDVLRVLLDETSDDEVIQTLMYDKELEHIRLAQNEVRTDTQWTERLEALDRDGLDGETDEQAATMAEIAKDFDAAVMRVKARMASELDAELRAFTREELEKRYVDQFRQMTGAQTFREAMRQSEIFFALRNCDATHVDEDWDHSRCDGHRQRLLETRAEVTTLPEMVIVAAAEVLNRQMSEDEAGNSGAPSVSSGPSGQRAVQEGSAPSTPAGM